MNKTEERQEGRNFQAAKNSQINSRDGIHFHIFPKPGSINDAMYSCVMLLLTSGHVHMQMLKRVKLGR